MALSETYKYWKSRNLLVQKAPFEWPIRETAEKNLQGSTFQVGAVKAFHKTTEIFQVKLFEERQLCMIQANGVPN